MGAWGSAIFSDDFACDVRDDYRDAIAEGATGEEAKARLCKRHADQLDDPDEGPVFWLALAATAWSLGRLDDQLKDKALGIIASGGGLERWDEPSDLKKRKLALAKLADKIQQPQRPPVKLRRRVPLDTDWSLGEIIGFQQKSGRWIVLHVVGFEIHGDDRLAVIRILNWKGSNMPPDAAEIGRAKPFRFPLRPIAPVARSETWEEMSLLPPARNAERAKFVRWGLILKVRRSWRDSLNNLLKRRRGRRSHLIGAGYLENDFGT